MAKAKPKICKHCKLVALTPEEEATRIGRCYWCEMEYIDRLKAELGEETVADSYHVRTPEESGRSMEEVVLGRPNADQQRKDPTAGHRSRHSQGDDKLGFKDDPNLPPFSNSAKEFLKGLGGLDVDNPPQITVIEARGNEGTKLRLELTAGVNQEWGEVLQQMLDQTLGNMVRMLTYGVKHDAVLRDMQQAMRPPQHGPDGAMPPGM